MPYAMCLGTRIDFPRAADALLPWPEGNDCGHSSYRTFSVGCSWEARSQGLELALKLDTSCSPNLELLLSALHLLIRGKFRRSIQRRFHESILNRVAGANVHRVFTLRKTEVAANELRLTHTVLQDAPA